MNQENHNHVTRMIRPPGECYSCDRYHALTSMKSIEDMEDLIMQLDYMFEHRSADAVRRYLRAYIEETNMEARQPDA